MADNINLKKLSRAELLEMMIQFSEESEAAVAHEKQLEEQFENEKSELLDQMSSERASMLTQFNDEKAEMRRKFADQKAEMQAKFEKDITGLKARLEREKAEIEGRVQNRLNLIDETGSIADASVALSGVMKTAQDAADLYLSEIKRQTADEIAGFRKEMDQARENARLADQNSEKKRKLLEAKTIEKCQEMISEARKQAALIRKGEAAEEESRPLEKKEVKKTKSTRKTAGTSSAKKTEAKKTEAKKIASVKKAESKTGTAKVSKPKATIISIKDIENEKTGNN